VDVSVAVGVSVEVAVGVNVDVGVNVAVGVKVGVDVSVLVGFITCARILPMTEVVRGACRKACTGEAVPGQNAHAMVIQMATRKRVRKGQRYLARDLDGRGFEGGTELATAWVGRPWT
jgi:hypothetical protein